MHASLLLFSGLLLFSTSAISQEQPPEALDPSELPEALRQIESMIDLLDERRNAFVSNCERTLGLSGYCGCLADNTYIDGNFFAHVTVLIALSPEPQGKILHAIGLPAEVHFEAIEQFKSARDKCSAESDASK